MKQTSIYISAILILAFFAASSCKKGSIETNYNPSLSVGNKQVIAERAYSEVFNLFIMVVSDSSLKTEGSKVIFNAQCTYQDTNGIEYIIDYGPYNTNCPDGKGRKGKISVDLNEDFSQTGSIATLHFENYTVNDLILAGNNTINNNGLSAGMLQMYEHMVPDATLTFYDTISHGSFHWESTKTFTWIAGKESLNDFSDDVFEISGQATGSDINGVVYSAIIIEALGDHLDCRWIRSGKTLLNTPGLDVNNGSIQYIGEDTCTNQVIYYFNGNPFYDEFLKH